MATNSLLALASLAAMIGSGAPHLLPAAHTLMEDEPVAAPLPSARTPDAAPAGPAVRRSRDGMFYVEARVNGTPVRFLVDTGASHLILTPADARRVHAAGRRGGTLATAGGARSLAWTTLASVRLAGVEARQVQAGIAGGLPVSLMGQDMLSRLPSLRIERDRLHLS